MVYVLVVIAFVANFWASAGDSPVYFIAADEKKRWYLRIRFRVRTAIPFGVAVFCTAVLAWSSHLAELDRGKVELERLEVERERSQVENLRSQIDADRNRLDAERGRRERAAFYFSAYQEALRLSLREIDKYKFSCMENVARMNIAMSESKCRLDSSALQIADMRAELGGLIGVFRRSAVSCREIRRKLSEVYGEYGGASAFSDLADQTTLGSYDELIVKCEEYAEQCRDAGSESDFAGIFSLIEFYPGKIQSLVFEEVEKIETAFREEFSRVYSEGAPAWYIEAVEPMKSGKVKAK